MLKSRIYYNPALVGKSEFAGGASTKNNDIHTPISATFSISALALALSLPGIYINVELQKNTRLAL